MTLKKRELAVPTDHVMIGSLKKVLTKLNWKKKVSGFGF
jgi:hypothetical protein